MRTIEELFVDENEVNKAELGAAIEPFARIGRSTSEAVFTAAGEGLSDQKRVLVALLVREAAVVATGGESGLSIPQIIAQTGAKADATRKALQRLRQRKFLEKDGALWRIRRHMVGKIREYLTAEDRRAPRNPRR